MSVGRVLIETYWNVKNGRIEGKTNGMSINRNILECKEGIAQGIKQTTAVLIETYWNVKDGGRTGATGKDDQY